MYYGRKSKVVVFELESSFSIFMSTLTVLGTLKHPLDGLLRFQVFESIKMWSWCGEAAASMFPKLERWVVLQVWSVVLSNYWASMLDLNWQPSSNEQSLEQGRDSFGYLERSFIASKSLAPWARTFSCVPGDHSLLRSVLTGLGLLLPNVKSMVKWGWRGPHWGAIHQRSWDFEGQQHMAAGFAVSNPKVQNQGKKNP